MCSLIALFPIDKKYIITSIQIADIHAHTPGIYMYHLISQITWSLLEPSNASLTNIAPSAKPSVESVSVVQYRQFSS